MQPCHGIEVQFAGGTVPQLQKTCDQRAALLLGVGAHLTIHFSARPALPQTLSDQASGRSDQFADEPFNGPIDGLGLLRAGQTRRRVQQHGRYLWDTKLLATGGPIERRA